MNLSKKYFLIFISTFMLYTLSSCEALKRNIDIVDLEDNYEVRYKKDDARNQVVYNQLSGKKLNGYFKGNLRGDNYKFFSYFKNGKPEGIYLIFKNDFLESQYFYQNGLKDGLQHNYISDYISNRYYVSNYKKGIKDGIDRAYENEKLTRESVFSNGIKNGIEYHYNTSGEVIGVVDYEYIIKDKNPTLDKNIEVEDLFWREDFSPELFQLFFDYRGTIRIKVQETNELYNENYFSAISGSYLTSSAFDKDSQWFQNNEPYYFEVVYTFVGRSGVFHSEVWFFYSINCSECSIDKFKIIEFDS